MSRGAGARGCTECKQGFYQDTTGHSTCLPCVPGKVMPSVGAISCNDCPANHYAATTAMESCVECEQGRSATQGSAKCGDCTAGKRKFIHPEDKTEMCVLCTAGKFQPDAGMDSCKDCQKGFYQDAKGQAACLPCVPGEFGNETGLLKCHKCAIGKVSAGQNSTSCLDCEAGKSSSSAGSAKCTACGAGQFSDVGGANLCKDCGKGRYRDSNVSPIVACADCPAGFYQNSAGSAKCTVCGAGQFSNVVGAEDCQNCAQGQYQAGNNNYNSSSGVACDACPAGFYQDAKGQAACLPCVPGEFGDETGLLKCHKCAIGKVSAGQNSISCLDCEAGKSSSSAGSAKCTACGAGQFSDVGGANLCKDCGKGRYRDSNVSPIVACADCPAGFHQNSAGSAKCTVCGAGQFSNVVGAEDCQNCAQGQYQAGNNNDNSSSGVACDACPAGFYQDAQGQAACLPCVPGEFGNETGLLKCHKCAIGKVSVFSQSTKCSNCKAGQSSFLKGSAKCTACGAGQFSNITGSDCQPCEEGQYRAGDDADPRRCLHCVPGQTTTRKGAASCDRCDLGKHGAAEGLRCTDCEPGLFQDTRGKLTCQNCSKGKIANNKSTACEDPPWETEADCKPGSEFLNNSHQDKLEWKCEPCLPGVDCSVPPTVSAFRPLAGWRRMSWDATTFGECPAPESCTPAGCAEGHDPTNATELCSQCLPKYARFAQDQRCEPCPDGAMTSFIFFLAVLLAVALFSFLVWDNLDGAKDMIPEVAEKRRRKKTNSTIIESIKPATTSTPFSSKMPFHSIVIRIVSSYLQVAGMLQRFDLTLPAAVRTLIVVEASSSSLSEQLLLFDCGSDVRDVEHVFFLKQAMSLWVIPFVSVLAIAAVWACIAALSKRREARERARCRQQTTDDAHPRRHRGSSASGRLRLVSDGTLLHIVSVGRVQSRADLFLPLVWRPAPWHVPPPPHRGAVRAVLERIALDDDAHAGVPGRPAVYFFHPRLYRVDADPAAQSRETVCAPEALRRQVHHPIRVYVCRVSRRL